MKKEEIKKMMDEFEKHTGLKAIFKNKAKEIWLPYRYNNGYQKFSLKAGITAIKTLCNWN